MVVALDTARRREPRYSQRPITPDYHPGDRISDLFLRTADRMKPSRERQIFARDVRRGFIGYEPPESWGLLYGNGARQAVTVRYGERTKLDDDLTNELSAPVPIYDRTAIGTTDTADSDADDFERWLESQKSELVDYSAAIGELVEYGEFGGILIPAESAITALPMWDKNGLPDPRLDKLGEGRKASRKNWREIREHWLATNSPFHSRVVNALDCAPRLTRGQGGRWEPSGLVVRTLFDEDDLIQRGYRWPSMGDRERIPRGFDAKNTYGAENQIYLYEAFLLHFNMSTQLWEPYAVYSVGGQNTGWTDDNQDETTACINFAQKYGARSRLWSYHWGVTSRDDPAYMGRPAHYNVLSQLLNAESLQSDMLAHTKANAFPGKYLKVSDALLKTDPKAYLDAQQRFMTVQEARSGELKLIPGDIVTGARADMGTDPIGVHESLMANVRANTRQRGGASVSGHAQTVDTELNRAEKAAISEGGRQYVEFVGQTVAMLAETWLHDKAKVDLPVYVTTEEPATLESDGHEGQVALPFNVRWTRGNWKVKAKFPDGGSLVDIDLERSLAKDGFSTFEKVRKKAGDPSPRTTWVKMMAERYMQSPEYQAYLAEELAARRGRAQEQKLAKLRAQNQITQDGTPMAAIEKGLGAAGGTGGAGGTAAPGGGNEQAIVSHQRAGIIGGAMEAGPSMADSRAVQQIGAP